MRWRKCWRESTPRGHAPGSAPGRDRTCEALGAPLIAFAGVVVTGLSVAGAFGVARLIIQDGHLSGLLNFTPQGFVDAWGPLFFGAMVFGVAMDYTLFLLTAAKERYETHIDPEHSLVGSVRTSGGVVVSAAVVMIAVFLTFALSGPLAPKEMGVILAVAVALDAFAVRLVLIPALLAITGHAAWYQPKWLTRSLPKVRSPLMRPGRCSPLAGRPGRRGGRLSRGMRLPGASRASRCRAAALTPRAAC